MGSRPKNYSMLEWSVIAGAVLLLSDNKLFSIRLSFIVKFNGHGYIGFQEIKRWELMLYVLCLL